MQKKIVKNGNIEQKMRIMIEVEKAGNSVFPKMKTIMFIEAFICSRIINYCKIMKCLNAEYSTDILKLIKHDKNEFIDSITVIRVNGRC